ncbi:CidA/LrgA family holin-like protein [Psychrobacillus glaciei]|uniref:CidA/LrgA family holin-like protein n=1 Tax=Psychrobacillus glaciei TaxID=2283160 RepID=A0A5J6SXS5_9BACI|nr:CidA/LrgA family holin-like protein [Psychrobacillus glaciei]QFG01118.1 CidA/LrgA family holin-like protein [Psychrobacillus glaciei]
MKKYIRIIFQIVILYLFSLLGSFIVHILHVKFPGSIVGLLLLFLLLHFNIILVSLIQDGAGFLLSILALFFVPATVGVMNYSELLSVHGFLVVLAVLFSTIFAIIISGRICQYLENKEASKVVE